MRLPCKDDNGKWVIDYEKAQEMVDYAYKSGVNYFDTAHMYHDGQSEDFVGVALSKYPRESFNLATKMPIWMCDTPADVERIFNLQLKKCKTDYFDFYLLHSLGKDNFKKCVEFGAVEYMQKMKEEGKIKRLGFSFHDSPEVLQQIVDYTSWDFAQIQLNYSDWNGSQRAKEQYEVLEKAGIPTVVMEPVRGGALASLCPESDKLFKDARPDSSIASWALRFVATRPNVLCILSGMSNMEQLKDNINTLSNFEPISDAEQKIIDEAVEIYRNKDTVPCTGCRYCMDCPMGVDIPKMFKMFNDFCRSKNQWGYKWEYEHTPDVEKPYSCVKCGKCEEVCPQGIHIPDMLEMIKNKTEQMGFGK